MPLRDSDARTGPAINQARLDEIRAIQRQGASSLLERIVRMFEEESAELLVRLAGAIEDRQAEEVRAAAHKFKGISGNVGAEDLGARCLELEQRGTAGRLEDAAAILEEIREEHDRASRELRSEVGLTAGPEGEERR